METKVELHYFAVLIGAGATVVNASLAEDSLAERIERDLLDVEQQVVQTRRALLASQIAMYSALGGGLDPSEPLTNTHNSSNSDPSSSQL